MATPSDLIPEPFLDDFVPPPGTVALFGYIGRDDDPEHIRLYDDQTLRSWLEIPAATVLQAGSRGDGRGSVVYVPMGAPIKRASYVNAGDLADGYLDGDIAAPPDGGYQTAQYALRAAGGCRPTQMKVGCCLP